MKWQTECTLPHKKHFNKLKNIIFTTTNQSTYLDIYTYSIMRVWNTYQSKNTNRNNNKKTLKNKQKQNKKIKHKTSYK